MWLGIRSHRMAAAGALVTFAVGLGAVFMVIADAQAGSKGISIADQAPWTYLAGGSFLAAILFLVWGFWSPQLELGVVRSREGTDFAGNHDWTQWRIEVSNQRAGTTAQGVIGKVTIRFPNKPSAPTRTVQTFWKHEGQTVRTDLGELDVSHGRPKWLDVLLIRQSQSRVVLRDIEDGDEPWLEIAEAEVMVRVESSNAKTQEHSMRLEPTVGGWVLRR